MDITFADGREQLDIHCTNCGAMIGVFISSDENDNRDLARDGAVYVARCTECRTERRIEGVREMRFAEASDDFFVWDDAACITGPG